MNNQIKWMTRPITLLLILCVFSACANIERSRASGTEKLLLQQAASAKNNGETNKAIDLYRRAVALSQTSVQAQIELAALYRDENKNDKALSLLLDAAKKQPKDAEVNFALAQLFVQMQKPEEALVYFDKGLGSNSKHLDLINGKGVALDMLARHSQAQKLYYQALDLHQSDTEFVQNNLAMSYIMMGNYQKAISQLTAIDKLDQSATMRYNLALAYGLNGQMDKAKAYAPNDFSNQEFKDDMDYYRDYKNNLKSK